MKNYRINRIINQYKFLGEERKTTDNLKKKYVTFSNACFGTECFFTVSELGMFVTSIVIPVIIPFSLPVSVSLTICSAILVSISGLIVKTKRRFGN